MNFQRTVGAWPPHPGILDTLTGMMIIHDCLEDELLIPEWDHGIESLDHYDVIGELGDWETTWIGR